MSIRMNYRAIGVFLVLAFCFQQSTFTEVKEVKTRWTYKDNEKNNNTNSLPDSIQIDLELESSKITLNLFKQSLGSIHVPSIMTQFEGQRSLLEPSKDEFLSIYKDPSLDASATVTVKKVNGMEDILYMATFSNGNESYSLEPGTTLDDDNNVDNNNNVNNNNNKKLLSIDGRIHSLFTISPGKPMGNAYLIKDQVAMAAKKGTRLGRRSSQAPLKKKKRRLMTIEIFTVIDYALFRKFYKASRFTTESSRLEDARKTIRYIFTHIMEELKNDYERTDIEGFKFTTSLGAEHDGMDNLCGFLYNFIMAPEFSVKPHFVSRYNFLFSQCSAEYFTDTVNELDSTDTNCLTNGGRNFNRARGRDFFLHLYPGQIYDLDDQCRMFLGPNSLYCGGSRNDEILCRYLECYNGSECVSRPTLNALDGTPCANGAWCHRRECIPDSRAPWGPASCQNGDTKHPLKDLEGMNCKEIFAKNPDTDCYKMSLRDECCASCKNINDRKRACQDIVDECSALEPRDCYSDYYNTTCCETCRTLIQNPSDDSCPYGDKGASCPDLVPEVCHLNPRHCCQSCASYLSPANSTRTNPVPNIVKN